MPSTNNQRKWLVEKYFQTQNAGEVQRLWVAEFQTSPPHHSSIHSLVQKFRNSGSVSNLPHNRVHAVLTPQNIEMIGEHFNQNPHASLRTAGAELGMSYSSVRTALQQLGLYPYKAIHVHQLIPGDKINRIQFANNFRQVCHEFENRGDDFHDHILWTDESIVRLTSHENSQNYRTWAFEQPNTLIQLPQYPQQLHIWATVCSAGVIGTYFFDGGVTAARYIDMLDTFFWPTVRNMPGLEHMFFMQDGATPHYAIPTREWLNNHFSGRWIGRGGPMEWPPRSPDLTPADFFLWPYLKEKVRRRAPSNILELRQVIVEECATITQQMCADACRSVLERCNRCIDNEGGHF